jgi:hypothetical protein
MTKPKPIAQTNQQPVPKKPESKAINRTPIDHYQHEKDKRANRDLPEDELMAAARREYKAMLEAQAAKGKGGRPKKKPAAAAGAESGAEDPLGDE